METTSNGRACSDAREWVEAYIDAFVNKAKRAGPRAETNAQTPADAADQRERCAPR